VKTKPTYTLMIKDALCFIGNGALILFVIGMFAAVFFGSYNSDLKSKYVYQPCRKISYAIEDHCILTGETKFVEACGVKQEDYYYECITFYKQKLNWSE